MNRRHLLAALLIAILAADLGWKAWQGRAYVVTGYGYGAVGDGRAFTVEYTLPGGQRGEWKVPVPLERTTESKVYQCWKQARIGFTIPDCMWSPSDVYP